MKQQQQLNRTEQNRAGITRLLGLMLGLFKPDGIEFG
jgi:hypothetical protein